MDTIITEEKRKRGRPHVDAHLEKLRFPLRIPRWLVDHISAVANDKTTTRSQVIVEAIQKGLRVRLHKKRTPRGSA